MLECCDFTHVQSSQNTNTPPTRFLNEWMSSGSVKNNKLIKCCQSSFNFGQHGHQYERAKPIQKVTDVFGIPQRNCQLCHMDVKSPLNELSVSTLDLSCEMRTRLQTFGQMEFYLIFAFPPSLHEMMSHHLRFQSPSIRSRAFFVCFLVGKYTRIKIWKMRSYIL